MMFGVDPLVAAGVVGATAATDAVYVMFTSAVVARRRLSAASWSSAWYLLSSFAVISYTNNWAYVLFAAAGSWIGAYVSITLLHGPPAGSAPQPGRAAQLAADRGAPGARSPDVPDGVTPRSPPR